MSRLPSLKPREVVQALKRAGFFEHHQGGSHLMLFNAESLRSVIVPMHNREMPRGTLMAIVKQSGFTVDEFREFL
jgi:predicted RNA binding protein YcfA (HicA-like mRNA interferase family)